MEFNCAEDYYQAIAEELVSVVFEPWIKIKIDVIRYEDSLNFTTVLTRPNGSTESKIDTASTMIPEYFDVLAHEISSEEKGLYKRCVFVLYPDGNFNADFEY